MMEGILTIHLGRHIKAEEEENSDRGMNRHYVNIIRKQPPQSPSSTYEYT